MDAIPLHRVALLHPFAQFLSEVGAPVESGFRCAGLPYSALEDLNNYVPSNRFWAFLVNMAHSQGIEDLGFRVGQTFGANSADPKLTVMLRQSPTLYRGLLKASEQTNKTVSHCQLGLLQPQNSRYTRFFHSPSCDANNPAIEQIGWFGLTALTGMVRAFAGPHWQPAEIGLMTHRAPCLYIREQFWAARIRLSQPYSYITLENSLLSQPPLADESDAHASSPIHCKPLSDDFVGSLKQVLHTYIKEDTLDIEHAAVLSNTSKRSLQRKLSESGTHYSSVRDEVRFDAARKMLLDPNMKVTDVAHYLGYSDSAHFSRAFRRIAGVNPREYCQQYQH